MTNLYAVPNSNVVMPSMYLEAMADTSMKLLRIEEGRDVSLILGYPVHLTNSQAIACWIHQYLSENPEKVNFRQYVFPALISYLRESESDLLIGF
jgi:hypothetical protein